VRLTFLADSTNHSSLTDPLAFHFASGRYDVDMFLTHFRLRGKTYDYKILHTSVTRLFLLPKADEIHVQLVVGLDPPIRQGQTRYPYLVMQFTKDEEMDAELNLSECVPASIWCLVWRLALTLHRLLHSRAGRSSRSTRSSGRTRPLLTRSSRRSSKRSPAARSPRLRPSSRALSTPFCLEDPGGLSLYFPMLTSASLSLAAGPRVRTS
jgi:hypothetical protein